LAFRQRTDNSLHTIQEKQAAQRGMLEEQHQWQGETSHTLSQMHQEQARENQNLEHSSTTFVLADPPRQLSAWGRAPPSI
jgi:hypothetical protein